MGSLPVFGGVCVAHLCSIMCSFIVFCACLSSSCVLCTQSCQCFLDCPFLIPPLAFSNVCTCLSSSCVLCTQSCQCFLDCPFLITPLAFSNVYQANIILEDLIFTDMCSTGIFTIRLVCPKL